MERQTIRVGQITIDFLLDAADTNGSAAIFEFTVPVGAKVPIPHYHEHYDETIYGLSGVLTFTVDGKRVGIGPGETCFIPRGVVHCFDNLHLTEARGLTMITPGLLGPIFFKEVAEILDAGGPPDLAKMRSVMSKHGLVAVMPNNNVSSAAVPKKI